MNRSVRQNYRVENSFRCFRLDQNNDEFYRYVPFLHNTQRDWIS